MDDRLKANLDAWNMMAGIHAASREYRLAEFASIRLPLSSRSSDQALN
jgi:hypothetical protein